MLSLMPGVMLHTPNHMTGSMILHHTNGLLSHTPNVHIAVQKGLCGCIHTPGCERYTYNLETPRTPLYVCAIIAIYMNKFEHNTAIILYKHGHSNYL